MVYWVKWRFMHVYTSVYKEAKNTLWHSTLQGLHFVHCGLWWTARLTLPKWLWLHFRCNVTWNMVSTIPCMVELSAIKPNYLLFFYTISAFRLIAVYDLLEERRINDAKVSCIKQILHVAVRLFRNRSQKTSKCGKNICDTHIFVLTAI